MLPRQVMFVTAVLSALPLICGASGENMKRKPVSYESILYKFFIDY